MRQNEILPVVEYPNHAAGQVTRPSIIAAFISHGTCNELLEHCVHNHEVILIISPSKFWEFEK